MTKKFNNYYFLVIIMALGVSLPILSQGNPQESSLMRQQGGQKGSTTVVQKQEKGSSAIVLKQRKGSLVTRSK